MAHDRIDAVVAVVVARPEQVVHAGIRDDEVLPPIRFT
jgi:hypothetical protein